MTYQWSMPPDGIQCEINALYHEQITVEGKDDRDSGQPGSPDDVNLFRESHNVLKEDEG